LKERSGGGGDKFEKEERRQKKELKKSAGGTGGENPKTCTPGAKQNPSFGLNYPVDKVATKRWWAGGEQEKRADRGGAQIR